MQEEDMYKAHIVKWVWPIHFKNEINQLIHIHVIFFVVYTVLQWLEVQYNTDIGVLYFIQKYLSVSLRVDKVLSFNGLSIFVYQFVHSRFIEIFFNMVVLGLAGHLLAKQTSGRLVVILYFIGTIISAIIFLLSHMIFNVLSGNTVMMGAQGGTLLVTAVTAMHYRTTEVKVFRVRIAIWKIWILCVLLSFLIHYNNSIAYYFVVIGSTYVGSRYDVWRLIGLKEAKKVKEKPHASKE